MTDMTPAAGGSRTTATLALVLLLGVSFAAQDHQHGAAPSTPVRPMQGLGTHHHKIATTSLEAQRLFDQGLVLLYGFNHGQLFAVARPLLAGRIAAAGGDLTAAVAQYRTAVAAEDLLAYDEPPTWYYPVRETLGAALLRSGKPADAEQVFREDLKHNPGNGRSLFGLWKSLDAQRRKADAARAGAEFRRVWSVADVPLRIEDL